MRAKAFVLVFSKNSQSMNGVQEVLRDAGYLRQVVDSSKTLHRVFLEAVPHLTVLNYSEASREVEAFLKKNKSKIIPFLNPVVVLSEKGAVSTDLLNLSKNYSCPILTLGDSPLHLLQRINEILRDQTMIWMNPENHHKKLTTQMMGHIVSAQDGRMLLEAKARFHPGALIHVESQPIADLSLSSCFFQKTPVAAQISGKKTFYNDMSIIGITPESARKMRKMRQEAM